MLTFKHLQIFLFTDTAFSIKHNSTIVNKCCQVFVSNKGYISVQPMNYQHKFETSLNWFCKEVGVPVDMIEDGFSSQKKPNGKQFCDQIETTLKILESATP